MSYVVTVRPIQTDEDLSAALARVAEIMSARRGTPEGDELDVLATLIQAYEREHYPVGPSNPLGAIRFAMDQRGLKPKDLVPFLGAASRVSEVLSGRRQLTLAMIRRLHSGLGIPLESLLGESN